MLHRKRSTSSTEIDRSSAFATTRDAWISRHVFDHSKERGDDTIRMVSYRERDVLNLLFNMYGSVWQKTFPYCLANTVWTIGLYELDDYMGSRFNIVANEAGLKYLSALLSFLVIARVKIVYQRMIAARNNLQTMYRTSQELVQHATLFTAHVQTDEAREWRSAIAFATIMMLEDTMTHMQNRSLSKTTECSNLNDVHYFQNCPFLKVHCLRKDLLRHRKVFTDGEKLEMAQEGMLLGFVDTFAKVMMAVDALQTTPFPFPLVQMARTILFFWIFSLPLGLVHDGYPLWGVGMLVFILTYGFIGMEYVSMELDDPFGDDPNDFDQIGYARDIYEDIYIMMDDVDGEEAAEDLRDEVKRATIEWSKSDLSVSTRFNGVKGTELAELHYSLLGDAMDNTSIIED